METKPSAQPPFQNKSFDQTVKKHAKAGIKVFCSCSDLLESLVTLAKLLQNWQNSPKQLVKCSFIVFC